jgi:hypothetical protein
MRTGLTGCIGFKNILQDRIQKPNLKPEPNNLRESNVLKNGWICSDTYWVPAFKLIDELGHVIQLSH